MWIFKSLKILKNKLFKREMTSRFLETIKEEDPWFDFKKVMKLKKKVFRELYDSVTVKVASE